MANTYNTNATRWRVWDSTHRVTVGSVEYRPDDGTYRVNSPDAWDPTHYLTRAAATKALIRHYEQATNN